MRTITFITYAAAVVYAGLLFVYAAWFMALFVVIRVRGVARSGIAPPVRFCCAPSLPAILGCAWTGLVVVLAGSGAAWAFIPSVAGLPISGLGPGVALLAFAIAALAVGAILLSVASAMLGNLPGVGASRAKCCCVETQALEQPAGARRAGRLARRGAGRGRVARALRGDASAGAADGAARARGAARVERRAGRLPEKASG